MGLLIKIDEASKTPLFRQIMEQVIGLVDSHALRLGTRLPSTRALADRLGVNRSTVYKAYQELWALGYLDSRPGSYSTVRHRARVISKSDRRDQGLIDWHETSAHGSRELHEAHVKEASFV